MNYLNSMEITMDGIMTQIHNESFISKKTQNRRFLMRPKRMVDEAMRGYMWRVADLNGIRRPHLFCKSLQPFYIHRWSAINYSKFGQLMGLNESEVNAQLHVRNTMAARYMRRPWPPNSGRRRIKNTTIFPDDKFIQDERKVCSLCLSEKNYYRHIWERNWYLICETHGTILIDTCTVCNKKLDWFSGGVSECVCGFDLSNAPLLIANGVLLKFYRLMMTQALSKHPLANKTHIPELYCLVGVTDIWETGYLRSIDHLAKIEFSRLQKTGHAFDQVGKYSMHFSKLTQFQLLELAETAFSSLNHEHHTDMLPAPIQDANCTSQHLAYEYEEGLVETDNFEQNVSSAGN